ncbi:HopJ type III effector protein [Marinobacter salexigens]|uniref:HopJ type III effector protein n=1 Tax=Marinobacter salexigens TaxID=1925763 RepID=A0ABS6AG57_9GAMM|nr:HopJ type III effector protein [Marinobacter salexigens]MBU2875884.1 HopJ type III effector protein [Marinobacter salexigens]
MKLNEALRIHLASIDGGHADFDDTLTLIQRYFDYTPTSFQNGPLINAEGENAGSCKVFALGLHGSLNEADTLKLFAQHYQQVLHDPAGDSHSNIRQFMGSGWSGIRFENSPLRPRSPSEPTIKEETHS